MLSLLTNLAAQTAQRSLTRAQGDTALSLQRLSTGQRINGAADDAAGLAISERMGATLTGLNRAARNTSDAISLVQVAGDVLGRIIDNFQRIRELAVQSANGSNNTSDRQALQQEADALVEANYAFAEDTAFNHIKLLDGSFQRQFQIGANSGDTLLLTIPPALIPRIARQSLVDAPLRQVNQTAQVSGALGVGSLTINGVAVGASTAGGQPGQGADSAFAVAAAINSTGIADVSATAVTSISGAVAAGPGLAGGALSVNGQALGAISGATAAARASSAAAALMAVSAASGVTASASGAVLTLSAADGRNITLTESSPGSAATLGLGLVNRGSITLLSTPSTGGGGAVVGGSNPGAAGLGAGAQALVDTGLTGSALRGSGRAGEPRIGLGSMAGAAAALTYLDEKIDSVNAIRSLLGATHNRLDAIHSGLTGGAADLATARSRIRDTDYASESTQLTRGQILRQAATAILAQANALPNQALLLLR